MLSILRDKVLWSILSVSAILLVPTLFVRFTFDNAINSVIARDWVAYGRIPYLQTFDHNFPGIILFHAAVVILFGSSEIAFRAFDSLVQLSFVAWLYYSLQRFFSRAVCAIAGLVYIVFYVAAGPNEYGQRDVYATMLIVSALFLMLRKRPSLTTFCVSSLLLAVSTIIRPTSALFLVSLVLRIVELNRTKSDHGLSYVALSLLIFSIPLLGIVLFFAIHSNGLSQIWHLAVMFNIQVHGRITSNESILKQLAHGFFIFFFGGVALGACLRNRRQFFLRYKGVFLLYISAVVCAIMVIVIQHKYFLDHFTTLFVLLLPMAASGINSSVNVWRSSIVQWAVLILCLALVALPFRLTEILRLTKSDGILAKLHPITTDSLYNPEVNATVFRYLQAHVIPNRMIEICSLDPTLLFQTGYLNAGGYPSLHMLAEASHRNANSQPEFSTDQVKWQREYVERLKSIRPYKIVLAPYMQYWAVPDFNNVIHTLPEFDSFLKSNYTLDTTIGGYSIFGLNR